MSSIVLCDSVQGSECALHLIQHNLNKELFNRHFLFNFLLLCTTETPSEPLK